mgnify:CR=1 FL=1
MADGESKPKHKPKADFDARATAEMEQHLAVPDWSLRQKLALTARMLAREEHGSALAGQITARGDDPATLWTARFGLGLEETRRIDNDKGRFTLVFMAPPGQPETPVELTYNWVPEEYSGGRNFGHLAYRVENIYETCQAIMDAGHTINRPPRDGHMAFVKTPDGISIELLQDGYLEPQEPWASMENTGSW